MANTEDLINFDVIEGQKENIQSIPSGRSARALAKLYSVDALQPQLTPIPSDTINLHDATRREFENELRGISESDDPLDIFDRYVKWTMDAYPSSQATKESGLLPLLERATKTFLNSNQYKNDPRYLKLWLSYIRLFSDAPRETFAFLARHDIGDSLALFYEEFASWLEGAERWIQAEEVYNLGIEKEATPAARLLRKYDEFRQRYAAHPQAANEPSSPALPVVRPALAAKIDPYAAVSPVDPQAPRPNSGVGGTSSRSGKPKLQIFSDSEEAAPAIAGAGPQGWDSIGSLAERRKENIIAPKPMVGETLKAGGKKSSAPKMAVFKDEKMKQTIYINASPVIPKKEQVTVNVRSGRQERIFVNLEAVYPTPEDLGTELSFEELRAINRGWFEKKWNSEKLIENALTVHNPKTVSEQPVLQQEPVKLENFRETTKLLPAIKPAKMQVLREDDLKIESQPAKKTKMQIFAGPEETDLNIDFEAKLTMADAPFAMDESGGTKVMLDENGNVMKSGREGRPRTMKTMEVNETQIIKTNLSSPSGKKVKRIKTAEPTMTFHTKAATDEIYDLFNQPLASEKNDEDSEASEDDDDDGNDGGDDTDGDYTSGGESTGTGRLLGTSEAGDDETSDVKSVSEWSDFTARKHIPGLEGEDDDTGATHLTEASEHTREGEDTDLEGNENEDDSVALAAPVDDADDVSESILHTPVSPEAPILGPRTSFVPIPPEDFVAPTRAYRDPAQVAQNRLPFMTPIAEKTESSLGALTCGTDKDHFISKTPSKENGPRMSIRATEQMLSSPFQEIAIESHPQDKIPQPALMRMTKSNSTTAIAAKLQAIGGALAKDLASNGPVVNDAQCNPVDDFTRKQILDALQPPLSSYEGFLDHGDESFNRTSEIRKFCKAVAKLGKTGGDKTTTSIHMPPVLRFAEADVEYMVKRELGAGAFAPVYLIEDLSRLEHCEPDSEDSTLGPRTQGRFSALKMESPPTPWEFHITRLASRRLGVHRAVESIIKVHGFHLYRDECYLIEEYRDQGTLLDLVNLARADSAQPGGVMDEVLVMWFSIELFRTIEALHSKSILHGDLKADNCLVRFDATTEWSSRYSRHGLDGWEHKGVSLIDFGRGIDMKAFRPDVQFIADWKVGPQDCAEMRECRPWTYQIDYHGLAGIIHSLLYGKYIDTVADKSNAVGAGATKTWRLRESFKRYWQGEIWAEVFDLLLNPTNAEKLSMEEGQKMPVLKGMKSVREKMETWVEANCDRGLGLQTGIRKLEHLLAQRR